MNQQDERFYTEAPKRARRVKPPKISFYEIRPVIKGDTCTNCKNTFIGNTALWYLKDGFTPFCRPECIGQFHFEGVKTSKYKLRQAPDAPR